MRTPAVVLAMMMALSVEAGELGSLFWDPASAPESYVSEGKPSLLLFPEVPWGGKASADAILIGVIDSGVRSDHPQLAGYLKEAKDFTEEGLEDELGHGTVVALIALFSTGKAQPPSALISAKVANRKGEIREKDVIDAIDWLVERGARIVNLSLGFKGTAEEHADLCAAILRHKDTFFAAAAGNYGPETRVYPAACEAENLLAVGGMDESGHPAASSGRGAVYAPGNVLMQKEWRYYYEEGQRHARKGEFGRARVFYRKSIETEVNAESELQIGVIDLTEKKVDAAIERLTRATTIDPALAEAQEMLGVALLIKGDFSRAEHFLRTAIDLYPEIPESTRQRARAHFNLGNTLFRLNRMDEARTEFGIVKQLMPAYPRIDEMLGTLGNR